MSKIPGGCICKLCGRNDYHVPGCANADVDELSYHVDIDVERMERALAGERITMPTSMSREGFRDWMAEQATKITHHPVILVGCDTHMGAHDVLVLGNQLHERLGHEYQVVIQKGRDAGDPRLTFDLEETSLSRMYRYFHNSLPALPRISMDELMDHLPDQPTEAWQSKRQVHVPQEGPHYPVSDSVLGLLRRAKGSKI